MGYVLDMFFKFDGRIDRLTYFVAGLVATACWFLLLMALVIAWGENDSATSGGLMWVLVVVAVWMHSALTIKRAHDMGYAAWSALVVYVPLIGAVWALVLLFKGGDDGNNEYGPQPRCTWDLTRWSDGWPRGRTDRAQAWRRRS